VQETVWLVLAASGSLCDGPAGGRRLDVAIELAAGEARRAIEDGDRVGVTLVDGRVVASVPPKDGPGQLLRIYDTLLQATELVDEDLTAVDDGEVARVVAAYVQQQDGLDFRRRSRRGAIDVDGLTAHVASLLAYERLPPHDAGTPTRAGTLRRFCRLRGIALPHRTGAPGGADEQALADALRAAGAHRREPARIVVVTDLEGVDPSGPLRTSVRLLRAHGHEVLFLVPHAPRHASRDARTLGQALGRIYALRSERTVHEARRGLDALGAHVLLVAPRPGGSVRGTVARGGSG